MAPTARTVTPPTPDARYKERTETRGVFNKDMSVDWAKSTWPEYFSSTWGMNTLLWIFRRSCYQDFSKDCQRHYVALMLNKFFDEYVPASVKTLTSYQQASIMLKTKLEATSAITSRAKTLTAVDARLVKSLLIGCRSELKNAYDSAKIGTADFKLKEEYHAHCEGVLLKRFQDDLEPFHGGLPDVIRDMVLEALTKVGAFKQAIDDLNDLSSNLQHRIYEQAKPEFVRACMAKLQTEGTTLNENMALRAALAACYKTGLGVTVIDVSVALEYQIGILRCLMLEFEQKWVAKLQAQTVGEDVDELFVEHAAIKKVYEHIVHEASESGASWSSRMQILLEVHDLSNLLLQVTLQNSAVKYTNNREPAEKAVLAFQIGQVYEAGIQIVERHERLGIHIVGPGRFGFEPNAKEALRWYHQASEQDPKNTAALCKLVYFYAEGIGCQANLVLSQMYQRQLEALPQPTLGGKGSTSDSEEE